MATFDSNADLSNEIPQRSFLRVCAVLAAIEQHERPSLENLVEKTEFPARSILSLFQRISTEYNVVVKREFGRRYGYYSVADWGFLNREKILQFVDSRMSKNQQKQEEQCELPLA